MSRKLVGLLCLALSSTVAAQDAVLDWNNVYLNSIRQAGGPPTSASWAAAIVHVSQFDAVNSYDRQYQPYTRLYTPPMNTSPQLAAAGAAYESLLAIYPQYKSQYDAALQQSITKYGQGCDVTASVNFGKAIGAELAASKLPQMATFEGAWPDGTQSGQWRRTPPDFSNAASPNMGKAAPWVMTSSKQYPPPPPPALTSSEYAQAYNEVKSLGDLNSTTRTPEQTQIAAFWANDTNGTYKPPGHLNEITQTLSRDRKLGLTENARLFALLNLSLSDAVESCWDAKYTHDLWRPVTGIGEGETDGNAMTQGDPNWQPLSNLFNGGTPPFPAYTSGHSTMAGAHAELMRQFFGSDEAGIAITTDDPNYTGGPRFYSTFTDMANENADSRVYLGVHWRFDCTNGVLNGRQIGDYVFCNALQPVDAPGVVPEPLTLAGVAAGLLLVGRTLRRRLA